MLWYHCVSMVSGMSNFGSLLTMLFSSWQFIFLFLPISFIIYFTLLKCKKYTEGKVWLVITSLFFYGYWKVSYLSIIVISMLINYFLGSLLFRMKDDIDSSKRKAVLCIGIYP